MGPLPRPFAALAVAILMLFSGYAYAIKPTREYAKTPASLGIKYDSLNIPSTNGKRLTAWLCHAAEKKSDQLIIIAGPDAGNMGYGLGYAQAFTANLGVDVLLFDYRGFGTSDTTAIDTDAIALPAFAEDLHSVVQYAHEKIEPDSSNIILYGASMGAGLAITVASEFGGVGGVIAESQYVTQSAIATYYNAEYKRERSSRRLHIITSKLLEPLATIQHLACPIMILHGELEEQISSQDICDMYLKCPSKMKTLWIVAGAGHMQIPSVDAAYVAGIYNFLKSEDSSSPK